MRVLKVKRGHKKIFEVKVVAGEILVVENCGSEYRDSVDLGKHKIPRQSYTATYTVCFKKDSTGKISSTGLYKPNGQDYSSIVLFEGPEWQNAYVKRTVRRKRSKQMGEKEN